MTCETALILGTILLAGAMVCFVVLFVSVVLAFRRQRAVRGGTGIAALIGTPGVIAAAGFVACLAPMVILAHVHGEEMGKRRHDSAANSYRISKEVCEKQADTATIGARPISAPRV